MLMKVPDSERTAMLASAITYAVEGSKPAAHADQPPARAIGPHLKLRTERSLFMGGEVGRLTGDWTTNPVPAAEIIRRFQRIAVARSRQQALDNDYMIATLRQLRQNIVGPSGVRLKSLARGKSGDASTGLRRSVQDAFAAWGSAENCDIEAKLSWRAIEHFVCEGVARDGEVFIRMIRGRGHGGKFAFRLQVIDPQRCPTQYDREATADGNFVQHGIEFTKYGKPVAYYFHREAIGSAHNVSIDGTNTERVPAAEIIHCFVKISPGQRRGMPWASSSLFRAKMTSAAEDAAVVNMRVASSKMGVIEFEDGYGLDLDDANDLTLDAEAGTFPILPAGARLKEFTNSYPVGELLPFVKLMLRGLAASVGVSYHSISGDVENVNFSSIRHATLDERENFKERQQWLIDELHRRVFAEWLPMALLTGEIKDESGRAVGADQLDNLLPQSWQPRRWQWIDPRADVESETAAKNNLLSSPGKLIRERGEDPDEVWKDIAADIQAMRAAGIPESLILQAMGERLKEQQKPNKEKGSEE